MNIVLCQYLSLFLFPYFDFFRDGFRVTMIAINNNDEEGNNNRRRCELEESC